MSNLWYSDSQQWVKRGWKETRPPARQRVKGWLGFALLIGLVALLWWQGRLGPYLLLGLLVFGAIWGGDKGPSSDEPWPRRRREVDWVRMLMELLRSKEPAPLPEPTWLPPIELEPMPSPPQRRSVKQRDREKLIKAMEKMGPSGGREMRVVRLKKVPADDVLRLIAQLTGQSSEGGRPRRANGTRSRSSQRRPASRPPTSRRRRPRSR